MKVGDLSAFDVIFKSCKNKANALPSKPIPISETNSILFVFLFVIKSIMKTDKDIVNKHQKALILVVERDVNRATINAEKKL